MGIKMLVWIILKAILDEFLSSTIDLAQTLEPNVWKTLKKFNKYQSKVLHCVQNQSTF